MQAHRGRTFGPEDDRAPGANAVLVLSHSYWQRRFGGDPTLIGRSLTVEGRRYLVVGIAAPGFIGTEVGHGIDLWVPISMQADFMPELLARSEMRWLFLIGRLKPGVALATAQAEVNLTLRRFLAEDPVLARDVREPRAVRVELEPGSKGASGLRRQFREPLTSLMVGVGLLLLIVWLNVRTCCPPGPWIGSARLGFAARSAPAGRA